MSKTAQALALVDSGMSQYEAAKKVGINRATLSRAWKLRESRSVQSIPCPCCRSPVTPEKIQDPVPRAMQDLIEAIEATPQATPAQIVAHIKRHYLTQTID